MDQSKSGLRRARILEYVKLHGKISVQELIQEFNCSEATARRDLDWLDKSGKVIRTIGGAVYEGNLRQEPAELAFSDKQFSLKEEKEKIAGIAASLVQEGDVVCLTGGTTTFFIARALKNHSRITIVTNAVNIAAELAGAEGIRVVVIGGVMRTGSYELVGPLAESVVKQVNVTKMFLGVDGVSREHGFTMHSELESSIAQQLIMRSSEVYPVFDDSKLKKSALFTIIPLGRATGIITNKQPEPWLESACIEQQVEMYLG